MANLLLTLVFVVGTALLMMRHVRRSARSAAQRAETSCCLRCGAQSSAGDIHCPGCGVPLQVFEVVRASAVVEVESEKKDTSGKKPHAVVRADLCVGCGTCVDACPEEGAIRLEGKLAVVDTARCVGHGTCAEACPVGGILLTTGASVHRVEVPDVGPDFQANVAGIYIVGELGGRGLIKNAINEGRLAVESIARDLAKGPKHARENSEVYDVVVVGSGPAGLSAGLEAKRQGLRYAILEQGSLADTIRKYPRHKFLLAEPVKVPLYGELWVTDASKEALLNVWEAIIAKTGLEVRTQRRVEEVQRCGRFLAVRTPDDVLCTRNVVLAMGRRGTPRRLGVPGEDLDKVFYDIVEMEAFAGKKMLVIGGGDSAVESALGLANQDGTEVVLSYRGTEFKRVKDRNRAKLDDAVASDRLQVMLRSQVKEIRRDAVVIEQDGTTQTLPNDFVIIRIGGEPPFKFLERTGINIVKKELPLEQPETAGVA